MNIVLTGSLLNIGRPLTKKMMDKGYTVTVISSNPERQKEIESLGARAAIGSMFDADFLTSSFKGADIVYLMETMEAAAIWLDLIHPDFLWGTALPQKMKQYEYFDYSVNEALFLSDKEEKVVNRVVQNIRDEYHAVIDKFTQGIIVSHLETLLNYSERFYNRQFITRKITNHTILTRMETVLNELTEKGDLLTNGLPTVKDLSEALNVSSKYLRSLLKVLTGLTAQQYIHEKLIEIAKEKLSATDLSISEIAYELGFEHPQSFSKLFKLKTKLSPQEFRRSFLSN